MSLQLIIYRQKGSQYFHDLLTSTKEKKLQEVLKNFQEQRDYGVFCSKIVDCAEPFQKVAIKHFLEGELETTDKAKKFAEDIFSKKIEGLSAQKKQLLKYYEQKVELYTAIQTVLDLIMRIEVPSALATFKSDLLDELAKIRRHMTLELYKPLSLFQNEKILLFRECLNPHDLQIFKLYLNKIFTAHNECAHQIVQLQTRPSYYPIDPYYGDMSQIQELATIIQSKGEFEKVLKQLIDLVKSKTHPKDSSTHDELLEELTDRLNTVDRENFQDDFEIFCPKIANVGIDEEQRHDLQNYIAENYSLEEAQKFHHLATQLTQIISANRPLCIRSGNRWAKLSTQDICNEIRVAENYLVQKNIDQK